MFPQLFSIHSFLHEEVDVIRVEVGKEVVEEATSLMVALEQRNH